MMGLADVVLLGIYLQANITLLFTFKSYVYKITMHFTGKHESTQGNCIAASTSQVLQVTLLTLLYKPGRKRTDDRT